MKSKWIREYATGQPCCAICGAAKFTAPLIDGIPICCTVTENPVSYSEFIKQMWPENPPSRAIGQEFYEEYTLGDYGSVQEYAEVVRSE